MHEESNINCRREHARLPSFTRVVENPVPRLKRYRNSRDGEEAREEPVPDARPEARPEDQRHDHGVEGIPEGGPQPGHVRRLDHRSVLFRDFGANIMVEHRAARGPVGTALDGGGYLIVSVFSNPKLSLLFVEFTPFAIQHRIVDRALAEHSRLVLEVDMRRERGDVTAAKAEQPGEVPRGCVWVPRLFLLLPLPRPRRDRSSTGDDVVHVSGREGRIGERIDILLIILDQYREMRAFAAR